MRFRKSFREEIIKRFHRVELVIFNIENGIELGDVEYVMHFLREIEQLEFAARISDCGKAADQFSDPGAVDVVHRRQVQDDFLLSLGDQATNRLAQLVDFVAQNNAALDVEDRDVSDFASFDLERHTACARASGAGGNGSGSHTASQWR